MGLSGNLSIGSGGKRASHPKGRARSTITTFTLNGTTNSDEDAIFAPHGSYHELDDIERKIGLNLPSQSISPMVSENTEGKGAPMGLGHGIGRAQTTCVSAEYPNEDHDVDLVEEGGSVSTTDPSDQKPIVSSPAAIKSTVPDRTNSVQVHTSIRVESVPRTMGEEDFLGLPIQGRHR
jgi:hypothetical protein